MKGTERGEREDHGADSISGEEASYEVARLRPPGSGWIRFEDWSQIRR